MEAKDNGLVAIAFWRDAFDVKTIGDLENLFDRTIRNYDVIDYQAGELALPGMSAYELSTSDEFSTWKENYYRRHRARVDPVAGRLAGDWSSFAWDELFSSDLSKRQLQFMAEAADIGFKNGVTVVTQSRPRPAFCSFVMASSVVSEQTIDILDMITTRFFQAVDRLRGDAAFIIPHVVLSPQQMRCLGLYLKGLPLSTIAEEMNVSDGTVRAMYPKIIEKLDAPNMRCIALRYAGWVEAAKL